MVEQRGGTRIYDVYKSSSFVRSNVRAFLEYILPAGGSSAINITRGSNPRSDGRRRGRRRRERHGGERVIVFPVSRSNPVPPSLSLSFPTSVFPLASPFFDGRPSLARKR